MGVLRRWLAACCVVTLVAMSAISANAQSPADPVSAGAHRAYSTLHSIGVEWDITNDTDHDAAASADYRVSGSTTWRQAMPLVRIDYNGVNRLAGSILFLAPDTAYEVRLALSDPDGGGETRTINVRTRRVPVAPTGRVWHVVPGTGGGDGSEGNPFRGIPAAQTAAAAGDTFLLHAGTYNGVTRTDGTVAPIRFSTAGTSTSYIAWKAAGDGEVLFGSGVEVAASHVWLEGIAVRNRTYALLSVSSPTNVVITRSTFERNRNAIKLNGAGSNWYIADNTIVGDRTAAGGSISGEGIDLGTSSGVGTSGHTVAYNSISNVADGVSGPHTNVDIFGNDIFDTSDDGIEPDYGWANVRMWGNRIHNAAHNGITFQPQNGGPWYIIRNQIVSNAEGALKFRTTDRFVLLHNTIVNWGTAWPGASMMCCNEGHLLRGYARNNLWISVQGGQIWGFDDLLRDWRTDLDYDGFDWGDSSEPFAYAGVTHPDLFSFSTASGLETHGVRVRWNTCFEDFQVSGPSPAPVPPHRMTLRAECAAVDAGESVANINDGHIGSGPDLGAHERGAPPAVYGPRASGASAPAAPSFLRATASGPRIELQWTDNSTDEAGFRVERSTDGSTFTALATVGAEVVTYIDSAVSSGNTYYYRVAAYNDAGLSSYSNTASAMVASNVPPAVRVTTPVDGATFTAPASIAIAADASDSDGSVARVEFLSDGSVIGSDTTSPFSFTWNNVPAGSYTLTARAIDNLGASTTSTGVNATVQGSTGGVREIVLHTRYASIGSGWTVTTDATAASGARLQNPNLGAARVEPPLAQPSRYFDMTFNADAGVGYRLWMRGQAISNSWSNDSAWAQFDRSVTATGAATLRIGTTSATKFALQPVPNATLSGWGWEDNEYDGDGPLIYFSGSGQQRIRVQVREDGLAIDQIVLSAERYLTTRPGATTNDTTILPATSTGSTGNVSPSVSVTAPANGATFTAPATVVITAAASDTDGSVTRVEFLANGTGVGSDTTAPWSFTWNDVAAGTYAITARATDNGGATTTSSAVTVTVGASTPTGATEVVLHARYASIGGGWTVTTDSTAASGARLQNPNAYAARVAAPLASPTRYFEMTFDATAGTAYRLWIRGRATSNHWGNDSVYVQFAGSVDQSGTPVYRIGTTSGTTYQVEDCSGCGLAGWGWQDNAYGTGALGPLIYFAQTGPQRLRIQVREDGAGIDQIVLSTERYLTARPGATKNDTVILTRTH